MFQGELLLLLLSPPLWTAIPTWVKACERVFTDGWRRALGLLLLGLLIIVPDDKCLASLGGVRLCPAYLIGGGTSSWSPARDKISDGALLSSEMLLSGVQLIWVYLCPSLTEGFLKTAFLAYLAFCYLEERGTVW